MIVVVKDKVTHKTSNLYIDFQLVENQIVKISDPTKSYYVNNNCYALSFDNENKYSDYLQQLFKDEVKKIGKHKAKVSIEIKNWDGTTKHQIFDVSKLKWKPSSVEDRTNGKDYFYKEIFDFSCEPKTEDESLIDYFYHDSFTHFFKDENKKDEDNEKAESYHYQMLQNNIEKVRDNIDTPLYKILFGKMQNRSREGKERINGYLIHSRFNFSQVKAIDKSLNNDVTVIQGPPGTGKTTTLLNVIVSAILNNKTILVTSNTNKAVDNIVEALEEMKLPKFWLRLGNKESVVAEASKTHEKTQELKITKLNDQVDVFSDSLKLANDQEAFNKLFEQKQNLNYLLNNFEKSIDPTYNFISDASKLQEIRNNFAKLLMIRRTFLDKLLVSRANKKFEKLLALEKQSLTEMYRVNNYIDELSNVKNIDELRLFNIGIKDVLNKGIQYLKYQIELKSQIDILDSRIKATEQRLPKVDYEAELKKLVENGSYFEAVSNALNNATHEHAEQRSEILSKIADIASKKISVDVAAKEMREIFKSNSHNFSEVFPVVFVTNKAISTLPVTKYDYLIIEEASQSDIQTTLPFLSMANRLILCGDSKQLAPIYTFSNDGLKAKPGEEVDISRNLMERLNISDIYNVVGNSLFKIFENTLYDNGIQLLDAHYRCHPDIINFSNKTFYRNKLDVRTKVEEKYESIRILISDPSYKLPQAQVVEEGKLKLVIQNVNTNEIDLIMQDINAKGLTPPQVAIISPFKEQVNELKSRMKTWFGKDLIETNIGTVETFQGKEFKYIYFSTVKTSDASTLGVEYLTKNEIINVAVSRAQREFILVACAEELMKYKVLKNKPILKLIEYIRNKEFNEFNSDRRTMFDLLNKTHFNDEIELDIPDFDFHVKSAKEKGCFPIMNIRHVDVFKYNNQWDKVIDAVYVDINGNAITMFDKGKVEALDNQVMARSEVLLMKTIQQVIPKDSYIFANMALSSVIALDKAPATRQLINKVKYQHFDYVVCKIKEGRIYVQFIIELDGESHNAEEQKERDKNKNKICDVVGLDVIRIKV